MAQDNDFLGQINDAIRQSGGQSDTQGSPAPSQARQAAGEHPADALFQSLIYTESRGRQTDGSGQPITSPKGAIGIAQVMPGTAPEAARLAGLEFDDRRYRTDPEYNAALGRAYLRKQIDDFGGDPAKGLAAYNAGAGRVQQAVASARAAGSNDWLSFMPAETRAYVPSILGRSGAGVASPTPQGAVDDGNSEEFGVRGRYIEIGGGQPKGDDSFVDRVGAGLKRGLKSSQALAAGAAALVNRTVTGEEDNDFQRKALGYYQEKMGEASQDSRAPSFTDAAFGDASMRDWLGESLGYLAYQVAETAVTGGVGALVGKTVGKAAIEAVAKGAVEREAAKLLATEAGQAMTKDQVGAAAARSVASKMAAGSAIFANNMRQTGGGVYADAVENSQQTGGDVDLMRVWLSSLASAGLDTAVDISAAKGLLGMKEGSSAATYAKRAAAEVPKEMGKQGGTEFTQSLIETYGAGKDPLTTDAITQAIDEGAVGALGGAAGGAGAAIHRAAPAAEVDPIADVRARAAQGDSPLSSAAVSGVDNAPAAPDRPNPSARLAELEQIARGTDGDAGRFFTPEERAEYDDLVAARDATPGNEKADPILASVNEIEQQVRGGGLLEALRAEGSPADVKQFVSDLAAAKSPSTAPHLREQALARLELAAGWAGDNRVAPPVMDQVDRDSWAPMKDQAAEPGQGAAEPAASSTILDALRDTDLAKRISDPDRQQLLQINAVASNPGLPDAVRKQAAQDGFEIIGRYAAPVAGAEQGQVQAQVQAPADSPANSPAALFRPKLDQAAKHAGQTPGEPVQTPGQTPGEPVQTPGEPVQTPDQTPGEPVQTPDQTPGGAVQTPGGAGSQAAQEPAQGVQAPGEADQAAPEMIQAPSVATPAGEGAPWRRKRIATLEQLVGMGFGTISRAETGELQLFNAKTNQAFALDSPADAQLARAAIARHVDAKAHTAATSPLNDLKEPSKAQIDAVNWKKGDLFLQNGMQVVIENPRDSVRRGVSPEGKPWETKMAGHYGELRGTKGADGDPVDVFVGPRPDSSKIYVIDQRNADGSFDEHKVMMGYPSEEAARQGYLANYEPGWNGLGAMTEMSPADFKQWVRSDAAAKPASPEFGKVAEATPPAQPRVLTVNDGGSRVDIPLIDISELEHEQASPGRAGAAPAITRQQAEQLQQVAQVFGKRAEFFSDSALSQRIGDGFVRQKDPGAVYLNVNSTISPLAVFGHEMTHTIEQENPQAYSIMASVIAENLKGDAPHRFRNDFDGADAGPNPNTDLDPIELGELTADVVGNHMQDGKFWLEVFKRVDQLHGRDQAKSIIARVAEFVYRKVDQLAGAFKQGGYSTSELVTNARAVRNAVREGLAKYIHESGASSGAIKAEMLRAGQKAKAQASSNRVAASPARGAYTSANDIAPDQPAAERDAAPGLGRADDQAGVLRSVPSYGVARPGAVSVVARHYSSAPRKELSSARYGQGMKGAEIDRLDRSDDPRIRQRTYFYVDTGSGITPESGVGGYAHEVRLNNLYDPRTGLIPAGLDANAFESAVLDAGFDGYLSPGFSPTQAGAVLLGPKHVAVPVKSLDGEPQEQTLKKGLLSREAGAIDVSRIPGARLRAGTLEVPEGQREAANAEFERIGSDVRLSPDRISSTSAQMEEVRRRYEGTDKWMKAPNGEPTQLTERQWLHVRTPAFKAWFGDWEKFAGVEGGIWADDSGAVSKVVHKNGEPLVVYHGTASGGFAEFNGASSTKRGELGVFTTDNYQMARSYARAGRPKDIDAEHLDEFAEGGDLVNGVYALFANIRKPGEAFFDGANWDGSRPGQYQVEDENGDLVYDDTGTAYFDYDDSSALAKKHPGSTVKLADDHYQTTDGAVAQAMREDHDGAIIRDVIDDGGGLSSYGGDPSDLFVAFSPNQLKSADFNGGAYAVDDDDIRHSKPRVVPESVDEVTSVDASFKFAASKQFATNRDFKLELQARALKAAAAAKVKLDERTPEVEAYLTRVGAKDAMSGLRDNANAVGWYNEKVTKALRLVSLVHPEISTDPQARFAFIWAMAVTSNGLKVNKNFELAEQVYSAYKATGKMPTNIKAGTTQKAINDGLGLFNVLRDKLGMDDLIDFMTTKSSVREIEKASGIGIGGEGKETQVYGAAILGPKIGNGFFMNLYGHFDQLTMDRWLMRTWGRWTGTLVERDMKNIKAKREQLAGVVRMLTPEAKRGFEQVLGSRLSVSNIDQVAQAIKKASAKPELRARMNAVSPLDDASRTHLDGLLGEAKKGQNRESLGSELRKLGNGLAGYLDGQKEAPAGSKERDFIRRVFSGILGELQAEHPDLTMSDLQAVVWYPEKRLYDAAKSSEDADAGYDDDEAPDYANAAAALAASKGISPDKINQTQKEVDDELETAKRAGAARRSPQRDTGQRPEDRGREVAAGDQAPGQGPVQLGRGARGSSGEVALDSRPQQGDRGTSLEGLPAEVRVDGQLIRFGGYKPAQDAARAYAAKAGIPYDPPTTYAKVDPERAKRIADEFERMEHSPNDPEVKAAYRALIDETAAQFQAMLDTGLKVEFITGEDPYGNPRNAILDVTRNNHLWIFPTTDGFGGSASADIDITGNPLLEPTKFTISGRTALANDLFRAVHDYFGHIAEGVGFRADGEENTWRKHAAMFSPLARRALTTETRGQNSWVNFGPYAEHNKTANGGDTQYAPQKIGLLPQWVTDEGRLDEARDPAGERAAPPLAARATKLRNLVEQAPARLVAAPQWRLWLDANAARFGVPPEELDALRAHLVSHGKAKVTREQLLEWLDGPVNDPSGPGGGRRSGSAADSVRDLISSASSRATKEGNVLANVRDAVRMAEGMTDEQALAYDELERELDRAHAALRSMPDSPARRAMAVSIDKIDAELNEAAELGLTDELTGPGGRGAKGLTAELRDLMSARRSPARNPQTESPAFKAWFGDSKVVDAAGDPAVMYHSTVAGDIESFKRGRGDLGIHFGTADQAEDRFNTKSSADPYGPELRGVRHATIPVYLSIQNPLRLQDVGKWESVGWVRLALERVFNPDGKPISELPADSPWHAIAAAKTMASIRNALQEAGYDGVVYRNTGESTELSRLKSEWHSSGYSDEADGKLRALKRKLRESGDDSFIAFRPEQIKSAIGNTGSFDANAKDIRKSRSRPWGEFPPAVIGARLGDASKHADHAAAKAGDLDAAERLVADVLPSEAVQKLRELVGDRRPLIVPVHAEEASGRNKIPVATADALAGHLGLAVDGRITQSTEVRRTGADGVARLARQPGFTGDVEPGRDYLLVDDTLTQGGTFAQLKEFIENGGGHVIGAFALTGKQYSAQIAPDEQTIQQLRDAYGSIEPWWRAEFGFGFDGLTQSEARYILKSGASPDAVRDRIAEERSSGVDRGAGSPAAGKGDLEDLIRRSVSRDDLLSEIGQAGFEFDDGRAQWEAPGATKFDDLIYKMQDKQVDTKRVLEAIKATGAEISDDLDVYLQEELYHGRSAKRTEDFVENELNPLVKEMADRNITIDQLDHFLHARHAREANEVIAQRNPDMQDGGSGMTNQDAAAYFADLPEARRQALEAAAARVDAILAGTKQLYVDYELESAGTVASWGQMFKHYVPLMREDEGGGSGLGTGQGFSIKGREVKSRTGSTRKVVDILANIALQREKAIVRGEKNRVSKALLGLAEASGNRDFWIVDQVPTTPTFNPKTGLVENRPDPMFKNRPNAVVAKVADERGEVREHAVIFNEKNERAMRMAGALKNLDAASLEGMLGASAKVTRYFAAINTQYNPVFGVVNLVRDVQGALVNLATTPLAGQQRKVAVGTLSALRGIYADMRAKRQGREPTSAWASLWNEFQEVGGQTGYRDQFRNSEDRANAIKKALDPTAWMETKLGKVFTANGALKVPMAVAQKAAGWLFDWLGDYNEAMENGVRLSAYKAGLEAGMSKERAASLAKNLTVNFNRKGQVAQQAGALYAFFNASMQGSARLGSVLFDMEAGKPKTLRLSALGKKVVAGGVLLGTTQAFMLAAAGFSDEDPPEFVRERSLVIPTGGKSYITIPMPMGLHILPNIGRITTEWALHGFDKTPERAIAIAALFTDSFNPLGNAGLSMQTVAPTVLDPFVALRENKDFTGRPIAKESRNPAIPGHLLARDTSTKASQILSEAINYLSGGNHYVAGVFSPTPDQIDYLAGQVGGGVWREASKVEQTGRALVSGEDLPLHKIPLVGRFVGDAKSQSSEGANFYANVNELNRLETEVKGLRQDGKFEQAQELLRDRPDSYLITQANAAERQIQKLRKAKSDLVKGDAPREQVKAMEDRITAAMARLNRAVEQLRARSPA